MKRSLESPGKQLTAVPELADILAGWASRMEAHDQYRPEIERDPQSASPTLSVKLRAGEKEEWHNSARRTSR